MESMSHAKAFIRECVMQEVALVRLELIRTVVAYLAKLKQESRLAGLGTAVDMTRCDEELVRQTRKLAMLLEGGIRNILAIEKGDKWAKGATIHSAYDLVTFVANQLQETDAWRQHAFNVITDLMETPVSARDLC
jgi:hypothetical protein